jgi:ArsR family transcriptional regulator
MRIRNDYSKSKEILNEEVEHIAKISDALAHPARVRLLRYIMDCNRTRQKVCNKDLVAEFDYAQATISQHMKVLIDSGLVSTNKIQRNSYYYVKAGALVEYAATVQKL